MKRFGLPLLASYAALHAGSPAPEQVFSSPPAEAKPWVFWWFESGYGGAEGMRRDIAAMKEQGIGGVMHMQTVNSGGLPVPAQPKMLSPEWDAWFGPALGLAHEAGLTMTASIVDGWAHGGWWVTPEQSAKQLVYSETQVDAASPLATDGVLLPQPATRLNLYRDVAVVAFAEKTRLRAPAREVVASAVDEGYCKEENWPAIQAADGDPDTVWRTPAKLQPTAEKPVYLTFTYDQPQTMSACFLGSPAGGGPAEGEFQASDDGKTFRSLGAFTLAAGERRRIPFTSATARYFRLQITRLHAAGLSLGECQFLRDGDEPWLRTGIRFWPMKSANRGWFGWPEKPFDCLDGADVGDGDADLDPATVVDLSTRLRSDGHLDWRPPSGRWTVLRFGWTPLAAPARMGSGGWEVDVLSPARADFMMDTVAQHMRDLSQRYAEGAPLNFHTDSWEIGADGRGQQPTWTEDYREQFKSRRGYDLLPYLPALARRVVGDRERTNRFLWDVRATVSDLIAAYYGRLQERAHALKGEIVSESGYGSYPHPHLDGLQVFGRADRPMAELWHPFGRYSPELLDEVDIIRTAASATRIYGNRFTQAEALTFHPRNGIFTAPESYRRTLNEGWARGLNQITIHKYVHQPEERKPGLIDYSILDRHSSWWPLASGLTGYIARTQSLLQQGEFVADVAYFIGEGSMRYVPARTRLNPALPEGYEYDGINTEVLHTRAAVADGLLRLSTGPRYRCLVLSQPQCSTLTAPTLGRLRELVEKGLVLVGPRPTRSPGLGKDSGSDADFRAQADALWGAAPTASGQKSVGLGRVVWGRPLAEVLTDLGAAPDCELVADGKPAPVGWLHRRTADSDIYYFENATNSPINFTATVRSVRGNATWFDPLDGTTRGLPERAVAGKGRARLPLRLDPDQAGFLVLSNAVGAPPIGSKNILSPQPVLTIETPWRVSFDAEWIKPALPDASASPSQVTVDFPVLSDWTKRPEPGIQAYSGVAVYRTRFDANACVGQMLDLGTVYSLARVTLNGRELGVAWCGPRRVPIPAGLLKPQGNELMVEVANLWNNRMAADAALPESERLTRAGFNLQGQAAKNGPKPAGLLGPVRILGLAEPVTPPSPSEN